MFCYIKVLCVGYLNHKKLFYLRLLLPIVTTKNNNKQFKSHDLYEIQEAKVRYITHLI